jgi:hypothetical protein
MPPKQASGRSARRAPVSAQSERQLLELRLEELSIEGAHAHPHDTAQWSAGATASSPRQRRPVLPFAAPWLSK